jgi:CubicO group peptidase (beta-lactamase class C family)
MKNLYFILLSILVSCNTIQNKKAESIRLENLQNKIDSLFNSKIGEETPGAALLISYEGKMLVGKGYGLRDIQNNEPVTKNTNFRMASVSKQFTALAVLSLIDKGLITLNDSVYNFFPYEVFKNISIGQFLNHTSGIAICDSGFVSNWDTTVIAQNKDVLEWFIKNNPKSAFEPGEDWQYSNNAYEILVLLVEKVSGQDFEEYVKENIFEKANMTNTNFFNLAKPIFIAERAICYEKDSLQKWINVDGHWGNGIIGSGGLFTNVNDFFQYDKNLRRNVILSPSIHKIIFKPSSMLLPEKEKYHYNFLNGADEYYAMGWFVTEDFALHTGSWIGTRTIVVRENKRPLTIAIFLNSNTTIRDELIDETYKLINEYLKTTANKV